ncbi:mitofilin family membrane protein [Zavarzinia aquatilis]|uniref:Inner membrane protein n=1 Tax=Zavarzinia aquatilis TaxID=2211142 RepID=A0A317EDN6_9PROT|nr:mitofilin family membrane protein [Zavarzinia aquatilis]PWR24712.1 hypothetical protein DKG74_07885 [Zavarzinia aquatilis]
MTERPDQPGQKPDPRDLDIEIEAATGGDAGPGSDAPILDKPLEDPPPRFDSSAYAMPPAPRGSRRSLWLGVSAIVLIGAGAAIWHFYGERLIAAPVAATAPIPVNGGALESRVGALETAVASLDRKLQALEGRVAAAGDSQTGDTAAEDPSSSEAALAELRDEIAALRERQGALEENLAATEDGGDTPTAEPASPEPAPAPAPGGIIADTALSARMAALEAKLAALPMVDPEALAGLEREIAALKTASAETDTRIASETERLKSVGRGVSLVYAIGRLRSGVEGEAPFAAPLDAVRGHFEALGLLREPAIGKALDTLSAHAAAGLPNRASLAARFAAQARAALQAARIPQDGDMVDRLLAEAGNLVTVRPIGEIEGDSVEARLARAEARLGRGDLAGALTEIAPLQGGAANALAGWKADAEARLAAETAVDLLDGEVSARFAEAN